MAWRGYYAIKNAVVVGFNAKDRVFGCFFFWGGFFIRPSRLNVRSKNIKTSLGSVGGRVPSLRKPLDGL